MARPGGLGCVQVKAGAHAKVPVVVFAVYARAAGAGVGREQGQAQLGGAALGAGLGGKGFFGAGEPGQKGEQRHGLPRQRLRWQKQAKPHGQARFTRGVFVKPLHTAKAAVFAQKFESVK